MDAFDLRLWPGFGSAGGCLDSPAIVDQIYIDSRRIYSSFALFVALKGEREDGHAYVHQAEQLGAKYALVSKDWRPVQALSSLQLLRVDNPLKAFQEIAKTYRLQLPIQIIGIAGSFGKTMVKDLLFALLATTKQVAASPESFNSQIGVPLSLLTLRKQHEIGIIEAGISKKEEMEALTTLIQPDYTILAPIGKKHLATLDDLPTIAQEAMGLILSTPRLGWALLPEDNLLSAYYPKLACPSYFWNKDDPRLPHAAAIHAHSISPAPYQLSFPNGLSYRGVVLSGYSYFFNLINMAVKAAWLLGIKANAIEEVLSSYQPEAMRTEIWKSPLGATFINDTYCSDPQSIDLALRYLDDASSSHRKIFVFGGMRGPSSLQNEADYGRIGKALNQTTLQHIVLFGDKPFKPLIEELEKGKAKPEITQCASYAEAIGFLSSHIRSNDFVLIKGEKKASFDTLIETFNDSLTNNQCVVNLAAIEANLLSLRKKLPIRTRLMVMVKALAYGTDDVRMARSLAKCGVDLLGVSYVDEAVALRRAGIEQAIFSINAALYEAAKVVKWELEVGVSDKLLIEELSEQARKAK